MYLCYTIVLQKKKIQNFEKVINYVKTVVIFLKGGVYRWCTISSYCSIENTMKIKLK